MKNSLIIKFKSKFKLNIKGKNIERFIKRLRTNDIEILKLEYLKYNNVNIIIYKKDYEKLIQIKSIYDVDLIDKYGIIKIREIVNIYKMIIIIIIFSILLLIFLSNIIFDVKIVHNDKEIRKFIKTELEEHGIKKYKFKKSYHEIQEIKDKILDEYKDYIEWLEIESIGTSYIVRLQNRIIKEDENLLSNRNVVAKKSAIIKKIIAEKGEVVKEINTYVNKGDIIISGDIHLNENVMQTIPADGVVYGEVWYNVSVEYPYIYSEIKETGNIKDVYVLKIINKNIEFTLNKFEDKRLDEEIIIFNSLLPISLVKQKQKELNTISLVLTEEEARNLAINKAKEKMNEKLNENEYIIDEQILKAELKENKIILSVFFSVFEDITDYNLIERQQ